MRSPSEAETALSQIRMFSFALIAGVLVFAGVVTFMQLSAGEPLLAMETPVRLTIALVGAGFLARARWVTSSLSTPTRESYGRLTGQRLTTAVIAGQAVREAMGMAAGVMGLITNDLALMGALTVAAAFTMFINVPSGDDVRARLGQRG